MLSLFIKKNSTILLIKIDKQKMRKFYKLENTSINEIKKWEHKSWVDFMMPDIKEKEFLYNNLKVPKAFLNDIRDIDERPRVEHEDGWLFIVLRIPIRKEEYDSPFLTVPLGIILKDDIFVTISFHENEIISDFIKYTKIKKITVKNFYELILRIFISSSVWYSKYLKQINKMLAVTEDILEKSIKNKQLQKLFSIEKSLIYFTTTLADHTFLFKRLKVISKFKTLELAELLEDVEIELMQAQTTTRIIYDIIRRSEESFDSIISNNLNNVMKHLTAISIILMIPTLIASFYGMNVPNHLENNPFAFVALILASFVISIIGFIFFKKVDWF